MTRTRSRGGARGRTRGFTLVELLTALLILALLAVLSLRGLTAVLDTGGQVGAETDKWRDLAALCARFERDVRLASPRAVRTATGTVPAWVGRAAAGPGARLELSRFAASGGADTPRRIAYALNDRQQIEVWISPGLDVAPGQAPARHAVLGGVAALELHYLDSAGAWVAAWPAEGEAPVPRAVRLRIVLATGEDVVRVFALRP